ncbi:unnamed protein product [Pleuronectes platessa]|uniref:Uncharacterized protein n=1 Tax=Pleuronectes platessa TaxID=8262 RepID=A0A9N7YQ02_PLEPL|nr:unnamed protein product [Pleuronectes platessa]
MQSLYQDLLPVHLDPESNLVSAPTQVPPPPPPHPPPPASLHGTSAHLFPANPDTVTHVAPPTAADGVTMGNRVLASSISISIPLLVRRRRGRRRRRRRSSSPPKDSTCYTAAAFPAN